MKLLILIINGTFLAALILLIPYFVLYRSEVLQIERQLGISPPKFVINLIQLSTYFAVIVSLMIFLVILGTSLS